MSALVFDNVRLIDPANDLDTGGRLVVEDGTISALGPSVDIPKDAKVIDGRGQVLAPGLIDMRCFIADSAAAAAGGVTGIALQPNQNPIIENAALVQQSMRLPDRTRVHVMGAATKGLAGQEMAEIGLMANAGAVAFTDGLSSVANALVMRRLLEYAQLFDALIVQFAQEPDLARHGVAHESELATRLGLGGIPAAAEALIIERDVRLLRLTGGRYHVAELSAAESLPIIARAKADDLDVTAAVSIHHLRLNETACADYRTFGKLSPPLRSEADRAALAAAVADGTIDIICSSHMALDEDAKRLPFDQAAAGLIGLEFMLPLALGLYHNGLMSLPDVLATVTCNPARRLGLPFGTMEEGAPADLVLFDPDKPWRVDKEKLVSATKNTPFDGTPLQGRVSITVLGGRVVYDREARSQ